MKFSIKSKDPLKEESEWLATKICGKEKGSAQKVIAEYIKDLIDDTQKEIGFPVEDFDVTISTRHDEKSVTTQLVFTMTQERDD